MSWHAFSLKVSADGNIEVSRVFRVSSAFNVTYDLLSVAHGERFLQIKYRLLPVSVSSEWTGGECYWFVYLSEGAVEVSNECVTKVVSVHCESEVTLKVTVLFSAHQEIQAQDRYSVTYHGLALHNIHERLCYCNVFDHAHVEPVHATPN